MKKICMSIIMLVISCLFVACGNRLNVVDEIPNGDTKVTEEITITSGTFTTSSVYQTTTASYPVTTISTQTISEDCEVTTTYYTTEVSSTNQLTTSSDIESTLPEETNFANTTTVTYTNSPANNEDFSLTYLANGYQTWYDVAVATQVWTDDLLSLNGINESELNNIIEYGTIIYIPSYSKWNGNDFSPAPYIDTQINDSGTLLGSSTLSISTSWGSWQNIKISANAINGLVLYNGDAFNWFSTPGLGACQDGYELGGIINAYGQPDTGYGGGVCFTASCLNDCAVWQCNMTPDRWNSSHSQAPSYIEWGRDATVDYPGQNFIFYNDTGYNVIFYATISEWSSCSGSLTISCYIL